MDEKWRRDLLRQHQSNRLYELFAGMFVPVSRQEWRDLQVPQSGITQLQTRPSSRKE